MRDPRQLPDAGATEMLRADPPGHAHSRQRDPYPIEDTGGWDAYEVWRRLIKDARQRRQHAGRRHPG